MAYKTVISFNNHNLGQAVNVFWTDASELPADNVILADHEQWIESLYAPIRQVTSQQYTFIGGTVYEVDDLGTVIRIVGNISPTISGTRASDGLALTTAASAYCPTLVPRVQGRKRFGGIVEEFQNDGLFGNQLVSFLAEAVLIWLIGPEGSLGTGYSAGVLSSKAGGYVPFADFGYVTNVPGTQVTRKPGRGQ